MEPSDAPDAAVRRLSAEEFSSLVAHELRNPLNALSGWLHLLGSDPSVRSEPAQRALGGARRALEQQLATIDLLARVLHLRADPHPARSDPIDLGELLIELLEPLRVTGRAGAHEVALERPAAIVPMLAGDPAELRSALQALGAYAMRHGTPGAPLQIGLASEDRAARVRLYIDEGEAGRTSIWHAFGSRPARLPLELLHAELVVEAHGGTLSASGAGRTGDAIDIRFRLPGRTGPAAGGAPLEPSP